MHGGLLGVSISPRGYRWGVNAVRLELPAEVESVPAARHAVEDLASRLECDVGAVRIAVSEAVGNCVLHAYEGREPGPIVVLARVLRGRLVITIADSGRGVRPRLDSPGLGLGLPLVSSLADDVRIESDRRGTAVSISFAIGSTTSERDAEADAGTRAAEISAELERAREIIHRRGGKGSLRWARVAIG